MEEIIQILMRRDGLSREEAQRELDYCINELKDCMTEGGFLYELESIVEYDLGLEPDFLEILLNEMTLI